MKYFYKQTVYMKIILNFAVLIACVAPNGGQEWCQTCM